MNAKPVLRVIATLLLCLGLPGLAAAETPTWKQHPTKNKPRKHVMVQFTDMSLHPSIAQVTAGGTLSWVNYASMSQGSIVFSAEMAAAFTCSDLSPNWMKTGTLFDGAPIEARDRESRDDDDDRDDRQHARELAQES